MKAGYKQSALGVIPRDWEVKELKGLTTLLTNGFVGKAKEHYDDSGEGVLYIQGYNVSETGFNLNGVKRVTKDFHHRNKKSILQEGDLLTIQTGDIGVTALVNKDIAGANCHALIISRYKSDLAHSPFFVQYFNSPLGRKDLKTIETGSTMKHLNVGDMVFLKVVVPPVPEQRAIANLLKTWDSAITITTKLIAQQERRKKGLMQCLLTGKKRLKGFDGEWKEVSLGDIFNRVTRKNTEGNQTVVTISAQRGFVMQNDFFNKIIASDITDNYFLVERGEFCYNKSYSNGYPWGAIKRLNQFEKAVVTTLYICFAIKDITTTSAVFFEQFFEAGFLDKGLMKVAHEGGRAHGLLNVTPSDFFSLKIVVPVLDEQTAIANVLQTADDELNLLRKKLDGLKEQKKGLMQILLTGKKRLKF